MRLSKTWNNNYNETRGEAGSIMYNDDMELMKWVLQASKRILLISWICKTEVNVFFLQ